MESRDWYLCDREKNAECKKRRCFWTGGPCMVTSNPAAAKTGKDGKPIRARIIRTPDGPQKWKIELR